MKVKKVFLIIILALIVVSLGAIIVCAPTETTIQNDNNLNIKNEENLKIVTTNFATYDFLRAIMGSEDNLIFLMGPRKRCS